MTRTACHGCTVRFRNQQSTPPHARARLCWRTDAAWHEEGDKRRVCKQADEAGRATPDLPRSTPFTLKPPLPPPWKGRCPCLATGNVYPETQGPRAQGGGRTRAEQTQQWKRPLPQGSLLFRDERALPSMLLASAEGVTSAGRLKLPATPMRLHSLKMRPESGHPPRAGHGEALRLSPGCHRERVRAPCTLR